MNFFYDTSADILIGGKKSVNTFEITRQGRALSFFFITHLSLGKKMRSQKNLLSRERQESQVKYNERRLVIVCHFYSQTDVLSVSKVVRHERPEPLQMIFF